MRAVIFDFDYTLADSSQGAAECVNFALRTLQLPTVPYEAVCKTIGLSLPETFRRLTAGEHDDLAPEFARLFKLRADEVMASMTVLYPSVATAVTRMKNSGLKLGIVSTKFRYRIEAILRREALRASFDVIVGGEDVVINKPDPQGLLMAMESLQGTQQNTIYTGDSVVDAETAARGGVPFVAIVTGTTSAEELLPYQPLQICADLSQFTDWLLAMPAH